jgi:hypothetical protein
LQSAANSAFVDAFHWGAIVGGIVLVVAVAIVVVFLPARATEPEAVRAAPGDSPLDASVPSPSPIGAGVASTPDSVGTQEALR